MNVIKTINNSLYSFHTLLSVSLWRYSFTLGMSTHTYYPYKRERLNSARAQTRLPAVKLRWNIDHRHYRIACLVSIHSIQNTKRASAADRQRARTLTHDRRKYTYILKCALNGIAMANGDQELGEPAHVRLCVCVLRIRLQECWIEIGWRWCERSEV